MYLLRPDIGLGAVGVVPIPVAVGVGPLRWFTKECIVGVRGAVAILVNASESVHVGGAGFRRTDISLKAGRVIPVAVPVAVNTLGGFVGKRLLRPRRSSRWCFQTVLWGQRRRRHRCQHNPCGRWWSFLRSADSGLLRHQSRRCPCQSIVLGRWGNHRPGWRSRPRHHRHNPAGQSRRCQPRQARIGLESGRVVAVAIPVLVKPLRWQVSKASMTLSHPSPSLSGQPKRLPSVELPHWFTQASGEVPRGYRRSRRRRCRSTACCRPGGCLRCQPSRLGRRRGSHTCRFARIRRRWKHKRLVAFCRVITVAIAVGVVPLRGVVHEASAPLAVSSRYRGRSSRPRLGLGILSVVDRGAVESRAIIIQTIVITVPVAVAPAVGSLG